MTPREPQASDALHRWAERQRELLLQDRLHRLVVVLERLVAMLERLAS